jgi:hypothetical protein
MLGGSAVLTYSSVITSSIKKLQVSRSISKQAFFMKIMTDYCWQIHLPAKSEVSATSAYTLIISYGTILYRE